MMSQNQRIEKKFYLFVGDHKSYQARFEKPTSDETTPLTAAVSVTKEEEHAEQNDKNNIDVASECTLLPDT